MAFQLDDGEGDDRTMADINVTPLVDVMLVLLIIFMITAPMLHQGVEVNLPQTVAADEIPMRIDGHDFSSAERPPEVGEGSRPFLRALGYSDDEIDALAASAVIAFETD